LSKRIKEDIIMIFAVIGGDMRQAKLAEMLAADGHLVSTFAIDKLRLENGVTQQDSVREAVEGADCVILPLPVTSREGMLNAPLGSGIHTIYEIFAALRPNQIVCAGRVDEQTAKIAEEAGIELIDYLKREELAVSNAVAAAEGAIQLIMEETAITVCHAKCLVIGFGRIGKILCHRLRGLGAYVTATARKVEDLAWIRAYGYEACETDKIDGTLGNYDVIVNTVPARILGEERLREVRRGALCLDLASKPGGIDFSAASKMGVKAVWALSLPGEVAAETSGKIIRDTIYNILSEKGVS
jgi:dipicolinate synthase subunit A